MPKDTNYACSYCEYTSKQTSHISRHIKAVHEKRKDYKCSLCDYAASSRTSLNNHTKAIHEKMKDFVCEQCDYKCSLRGNLIRHVKVVHKGIKEYECYKCGQKFGQNVTLKRHVKLVHEKENQELGNIQEHDHDHEGISVWECKKCVHGAKRQVKDDRDLVSGDPWICALCGFQSAKLSALVDHVDELCESEDM